MKFKLNFGKGGLKGFVIQHAEKGIFGMVLVLVAAFIYSSATQETVEQGESPSSLKGGAAGALTSLQNWQPLGGAGAGQARESGQLSGPGRDCPAAGRRRGLPGDDAVDQGPWSRGNRNAKIRSSMRRRRWKPRPACSRS